MPIFLPALVGAFVGTAITSIFNIWKFHRDERVSRCDELCKALSEAAALALDYWSKEFTDSAEQIIAEVKLRAAQDLFELLWADFGIYLSVENSDALDSKFVEFNDILTGGEYTVLGREQDFERAKRSAPLANRINVHIRRSNRETMPFYNVIVAYHQNKRRVLDMPLRCGGQGW